MMSLEPWPAASIIHPMMLLPLTCSPSFSTVILLSNLFAVLTNMAAGRAWTPSLLVTVTSLLAVLASEPPLPLRERIIRSKCSQSILIRRTHPFDEPLVEFAGRVVAEALEFLVEGRDLDQSRDVAARPDGSDDGLHADPEDRVRLPLDTGAVDLIHLVPVHQRDDQIQVFLWPHTGDTEDRGHIDDAQAADLHVVARRLGRGSHQLAALQQANACDVVADETVAALQQRQDALALADAALPTN